MPPAANEAWIEIRLDAEREQADAIAAALSGSGALSVTMIDAADDPVLEPAPGEAPLWPHVSVVGLFDATIDTGTVLREVQAALDLAAPPRARIGRVESRDWERARLDDLQPMRFGSRLWICPRGQFVDAPDAVTVLLDPGLAFGTGTHPTTALCLEWLDRNCRPGDRVIDYGCGSGILAIAAARLGAAAVLAIDIDPQALYATAENARANRVEDRITVATPEAAPAFAADCLLANILAKPLIDLAPRFAALLAPGGRLTVSGILSDQASKVAGALAGAGFDVTECNERDGWARLDAIRR
jgi:ribosomal protein L11 methyltransferase